MSDTLAMAVKTAVDNGARAYVRERDLPKLLPRDKWGSSTAHIVDMLERVYRAQQKRVGHWTYDGNRTLAIRGALQAEREALAKEGA